jgi:hypothetical protein
MPRRLFTRGNSATVNLTPNSSIDSASISPRVRTLDPQPEQLGDSRSSAPVSTQFRAPQRLQMKSITAFILWRTLPVCVRPRLIYNTQSPVIPSAARDLLFSAVSSVCCCGHEPAFRSLSAKLKCAQSTLAPTFANRYPATRSVSGGGTPSTAPQWSSRWFRRSRRRKARVS